MVSAGDVRRFLDVVMHATLFCTLDAYCDDPIEEVSVVLRLLGALCRSAAGRARWPLHTFLRREAFCPCTVQAFAFSPCPRSVETLSSSTSHPCVNTSTRRPEGGVVRTFLPRWRAEQ